jgi:hypothetical protein
MDPHEIIPWMKKLQSQNQTVNLIKESVLAVVKLLMFMLGDIECEGSRFG